MQLIDDIAIAIMWLIRFGVVTRLILIQFAKMADEEKESLYKRRQLYTLVFFAIAESIYQIRAIIESYF